MLNLKSRVLNRLHVGFSLSRNFMKRLGQKVLVNVRFYFYLLQKPAHFLVLLLKVTCFLSFLS